MQARRTLARQLERKGAKLKEEESAAAAAAASNDNQQEFLPKANKQTQPILYDQDYANDSKKLLSHPPLPALTSSSASAPPFSIAAVIAISSQQRRDETTLNCASRPPEKLQTDFGNFKQYLN